MDSLTFAAAEAIDATMITIDSELLDHGAAHPNAVL